MRTMFLLIAVGIFGCAHPNKPLLTGLEGQSLPEFRLMLPDSFSYVNTKALPVGKGIVMVYFSPECPYCRLQIEEIIKNSGSLSNVQFCIFTTWPLLELKEFIKEFKLDTHPNFLVGIDYSNTFKHYFKVDGVPFMAIYSPQKKLNKAFLGVVKTSQIKSSIAD
jgi:hypothetical protein